MERDVSIGWLEKTAPAATGHLVLFPKLARLLLALFRDPRVPRYLKLLTAGVVTYVALPFDVLPDFVPLAGKGDDLLVIFLVLIQYLKRCPEAVLREHWEAIMGDPGAAEAQLRDAAESLQPLIGARFAYLEEMLQKVGGRIAAAPEKQ